MSPIERKLHEALLVCIPERFVVTYHEDTYGEGDEPLWLCHQVVIDSYRADFVIRTNSDSMLAIECDGHDWHERTKQQAAYDRARDRDLLKRGIWTVRFTGSEIYHSAERCAADVYALAAALVEREDELIRNFMSGYEQGVRSATRPRAVHREDL